MFQTFAGVNFLKLILSVLWLDDSVAANFSDPLFFGGGSGVGKNTRVGCHSLLQEIFRPRDRTPVSSVGRGFTLWATRETHSSTLAWKIPWMEGPGRLQSMGSLGVGHDWATSLSLFTFMHWRRKWQPTPVFLPGESQGWGSLVGCHLWGHTELDTTEVT